MHKLYGDTHTSAQYKIWQHNKDLSRILGQCEMKLISIKTIDNLQKFNYFGWLSFVTLPFRDNTYIYSCGLYLLS